MWTYEQASGRILHDGTEAGAGYSGAGTGKNVPEAQAIPNVGPIPRGLYVINEPHDTAKHGPYAMALTPDPKNQMFGRFAFLIHGDSAAMPGTASQGCIILPRPIREQIWASGDRQLTVVA